MTNLTENIGKRPEESVPDWQRRVKAVSYTHLIPSFCAVAATLNMGLVEMAEPLHVIPATYNADTMDEVLKLPGTKVLMKTGRKMKAVRESILRSGQDAVMIEDCGMPSEKIYRSAEEIPEQSGYYSLIIVKEKK